MGVGSSEEWRCVASRSEATSAKSSAQRVMLSLAGKDPRKSPRTRYICCVLLPLSLLTRVSSRAHLEGRAGPSARPISCQYHWGSACMAFLREASGRSFVTRAKTIRLNERFEATCACVFLSFYFTSPLLLRIPCDYIRCLLSHPAPLSCP